MPSTELELWTDAAGYVGDAEELLDELQANGCGISRDPVLVTRELREVLRDLRSVTREARDQIEARERGL